MKPPTSRGEGRLSSDGPAGDSGITGSGPGDIPAALIGKVPSRAMRRLAGHLTSDGEWHGEAGADYNRRALARGRRPWIEGGVVLVILAALVGLRLLHGRASVGGLVVAKVLDGDTVVLSDGRTVRYLLVDTPEEGEPFAEEARRANEELVKGRTVRLEFDREPLDRYGRLLAYVYVNGDTFVNAELARRGLANLYVVGENIRRREEILAAQREAIRAGRGRWSSLRNESGTVVGVPGRHVFHKPG